MKHSQIMSQVKKDPHQLLSLLIFLGKHSDSHAPYINIFVVRL
jgi:hypothetical protein